MNNQIKELIDNEDPVNKMLGFQLAVGQGEGMEVLDYLFDIDRTSIYNDEYYKFLGQFDNWDIIIYITRGQIKDKDYKKGTRNFIFYLDYLYISDIDKKYYRNEYVLARITTVYKSNLYLKTLQKVKQDIYKMITNE